MRIFCRLTIGLFGAEFFTINWRCVMKVVADIVMISTTARIFVDVGNGVSSAWANVA